MTIMARKPEQIIDEQVRAWTHRQAEAQRQGEGRTRWPLITVSREFGAQGAPLAELLGRRLGFTVWDKELVQAVAEESGGAERIVETLDEHGRKAIEDAMRGTLMGVQHTHLQYLRTLVRVVRTIAAHGNGIIVGRGANYICDPATILRVRVVCPLDVRVRRYAAQHHLDERQARRMVEELEAERVEFVRQHFKRDVAAPADYDLVVNSGTYTLEEMADVVVAAYEAKLGRRPHEQTA
jgi:cytidylate kinase